MDAIEGFMAKRDAAIESRVTAILEGEGSLEPDGQLNSWLPVIQGLMPAIQPYIPAIMERLGLSRSTEIAVEQGQAFSSSPAPQSHPASENLAKYITMAAKANGRLGKEAIRLAIPTMEKRLQESGIDPQEFKQAIINISKAYD